MRWIILDVYIVLIFIVSTSQLTSIQAMEQSNSSEIIINLPSRTLEYYENGKIVKEYSIAIGKPSTPTPIGVFTVSNKEENPWWYPPDKQGYVVKSGPNNPLGYRWMGIGGNYGIHGTNAPWSIGSAVSNGCIRMQEEDVEELFDKVSESTPVHITYERIKVQIDQTGQASIGVYPDIYQYKEISLAQVKDKLRAEGLENLVGDDFLSRVMTREQDSQVVFAKLYHIKINNKDIPQYLVKWDDVIYAPVMAIASQLDTKVEWDEQRQLVTSKQSAVSGMLKHGMLYVAVNDLPILFGTRQTWDESNRYLLINAPEIRMEGQTITYNVQQINQVTYVPVTTVAKALGKRLSWEGETNTYWLGSRKIAVTMMESEPYVDVNKISDYFNTRAVWNDKEQVLDLNHSCYTVDYSMYLGEMGSFVD